MDLLTNVALVPVIIGVVQALRIVGLATRFAPIVAILLGIMGVLAFDGFSSMNIFIGVVTGLSAAGLYSSTKTTLHI